MELFLTSAISNVINKVVERLPIQPSTSSIAFIDTAAETEQGSKQWLKNDRNALTDAGFSVADYTLTNKTPQQIEADLSTFDAYFVSGGNTFYLLEKIRQSGFETFLKKQLNLGKPYLSTSAGSIVTGPNISMTKRLDNHLLAPNLTSYEGMQLVSFVVLPHWSSHHFKELYLNKRLDLAYEEPYPYILLTDNQFVHVKDKSFEIID